MNKAIGYLGVPSAAGAHSPGIERAPAALRAAGLTEQLRLGGALVHDHGDLATVHFDSFAIRLAAVMTRRPLRRP